MTAETARQLTRVARKIRRRACASESCEHGHCRGLIEAARIVRAERTLLLHPNYPPVSTADATGADQ